MDHVGIVVEDLEGAVEFFLELGLERQGGGEVGGEWVDRVVGLEGVRAELAMLQTPDGKIRLEIVRFASPPGPEADLRAPSNALGLRHITFAVDDIDATVERLIATGAEPVGTLERYEDVYRLCYLRGPAGIIVELAERLD